MGVIATASHEKNTKRDMVPTDICTSGDIHRVERVLQDWHKAHPKRAFRIDITIHCVELKDNTTVPDEVQAQTTRLMST